MNTILQDRYKVDVNVFCSTRGADIILLNYMQYNAQQDAITTL